MGSLLDHSREHWRALTAAKSGGWYQGFVLHAHEVVMTLREETGWDVEYPRDVWRLHTLPGLTRNTGKAPEARNHLSFDHITQPWLELAKRWARLRLSGGLTVSTVINDVTALRRFSTFLDQALPTVDTLAGIDRLLLEPYLAWLATQPCGHGAKEDAVTGLHLFFSAIRQHGWDDTLPTTAVFTGDTPAATSLSLPQPHLHPSPRAGRGAERCASHHRKVQIKLLATVLAAVLSACLACSNVSDGGTGMTPTCGGDLAGFSHRSVEVDGVRLHYVIGGRGPAVVLLHGFPETWWTWRQVMPLLAGAHTVIAPDARGVGCSSLASTGYDTQTLARDVHALVASLGLPRVALVGHDLGGWVAYAYARQFRDQVTHLVLSGAAIPGFGLERLLDFRAPGQGLPHLVFFAQPRIPELLISGREREYFTAFIASPAMQRSGAVALYARSYARPGRLSAALGQYRAVYTDAVDNRRGAGPPLTMPTLALAGVGETPLSADSLRQVARNVSEVTIPGADHYLQEEHPAELAYALTTFLD